MSYWDPTSWDWQRIGTGVATGGLSEAGGYIYDKYYGNGADQQKQGYRDAGAAASKLGTDQRDWYSQQGDKALGAFSGGVGTDTAGAVSNNGAAGRIGNGSPPPTYLSPDQALLDQRNNRSTQAQDYFGYMQGQAGHQTNQEELYASRRGGYDPAAAYQDSRATRDINNQLAARGGYNSGAGERQIGDYYANANAQRSRDLAGLAGGADSSRLGVDTAYGNAASGASKENSDYYTGLSDQSLKNAQAKSDVSSHFSELGGNAYSQGQLAEIEANLAASGVDAATRKQFMDDLISAAGGAGKLATAGK